MVFYSWRTTKVKDGFSYSVYKLKERTTPTAAGYYVDTTLVKSGKMSTRPRAKAIAQKWVRYYTQKLKRRKK